MIESKTGVLLLNLGTPDSPKNADVRRYLNEFLSDPRVVDLPWVIRKILLHLFILPFRTAKSAEAYQKIWSNRGSPLLFHSKELEQEVQQSLGEKYFVALGMRYGNPTISFALEKILQNNCHKVVILPLFPQYSSAATGSAIEKTLMLLRAKNHIPAIKIFDHFYNDSSYIDAQSEIMKPFLTLQASQGVLLSYHSLPERQVKKSPSACMTACFNQEQCPQISSKNILCYRAQCYETSRLLAQKLGLNSNNYQVAFQSRLGRTKWIGPDLQAAMNHFIQRDIRDLVVACPSFVADCLETLEEIGIRAMNDWKKMGGKTFSLVPCLNSHPLWIKSITDFVSTT